MGHRTCRSTCQHLERLACKRGPGASNWRDWDAYCKVRVPATGERGCRSQGLVGPGGPAGEKTVGHRALGLCVSNWKDPCVFVLPSEFNPECMCARGIH